MNSGVESRTRYRVGYVEGVGTIAWSLNCVPWLILSLFWGFRLVFWLLTGHHPHHCANIHDHLPFVRLSVSAIEIATPPLLYVSLLCTLIAVPLQALLILTELVQRLAHKQGGVLSLIAISTLLWLLCIATMRWDLAGVNFMWD